MILGGFLMKKLMICLAAALLCACAPREKVVEPNGKKEYFANVDIAIDENDPYVYAGTVDYIFAGKVTKVKSNHIKMTSKQSDYYSYYEIQVIENIKGSLVEQIEAKKLGGFDDNGTEMLIESDYRKDTEMPVEGKTYMFMAYAQKDGTLTLSEFLDDRPYDENLKKEYEEYVENEVPSDRERYNSVYEAEKTLLKIGHTLSEADNPEPPEPERQSADLNAEELEETEWCACREELIPSEVLAVIKEDHPECDLSKWQMMIHFFDDEKSAGMLQMRYDIGEIATDRTIVCSIENNRIRNIFYANMSGEANEEELKEKVRIFENSTVQEEYELGEGDKFLEETVQYSYRYDTGKLIYTYNLFFEEPGGVINNSIGSEYIID